MSRKPRDYAAEYARRVARGAAAGKSRNEAVGKPNRDYSREYRERVLREVAAGKRPPPRIRPRNNQAPTGAPLSGARRFDGEEASELAGRWLRRLRGDRRVFLYVRLRINDGDPVDAALFPNGGIRAETLRDMIEAEGSLEEVILAELELGRVRLGDDPTINPQNRRGASGGAARKTKPGELEIEIETIVVQWT